MKRNAIKAVISIFVAIVLVYIINNVYYFAYCDVDIRDCALVYDSFGLCGAYTIDDENYALYPHHEGFPILRKVYSYAVSGHYVFLYGEDATWRHDISMIYSIADIKTGLFLKYKNLDDSPVEFREHLTKLPTHPTLPEPYSTRLKKRILNFNQYLIRTKSCGESPGVVTNQGSHLTLCLRCHS